MWKCLIINTRSFMLEMYFNKKMYVCWRWIWFTKIKVSFLRNGIPSNFKVYLKAMIYYQRVEGYFGFLRRSSANQSTIPAYNKKIFFMFTVFSSNGLVWQKTTIKTLLSFPLYWQGNMLWKTLVEKKRIRKLKI